MHSRYILGIRLRWPEAGSRAARPEYIHGPRLAAPVPEIRAARPEYIHGPRLARPVPEIRAARPEYIHGPRLAAPVPEIRAARPEYIHGPRLVTIRPWSTLVHSEFHGTRHGRAVRRSVPDGIRPGPVRTRRGRAREPGTGCQRQAGGNADQAGVLPPAPDAAGAPAGAGATASAGPDAYAGTTAANTPRPATATAEAAELRTNQRFTGRRRPRTPFTVPATAVVTFRNGLHFFIGTVSS